MTESEVAIVEALGRIETAVEENTQHVKTAGRDIVEAIEALRAPNDSTEAAEKLIGMLGDTASRILAAAPGASSSAVVVPKL